MQRTLLILYLCLFAIGAFAETVSLTTGESIDGKIIGFKDQKVYLDSEKVLFIISSSMITEILNEQNIAINIDDMPNLFRGKLNYNSFHEIKEIKPEKLTKLFAPRYESKKYGKYYDYRVNRMFYGLTARTVEKNVFSLSNYDLLLFNYCLGLSNNTEIEMFTAPLFVPEIFGISIKYQFYSHSLWKISLRSSYRYFGDPFYNDDGFKESHYDAPQSVIITYGNIDHYISGNIDITPTIHYKYEETNRFIPITYHLGSSLRPFKHMKIYFEIFNSWPFPDDNFYRGDYDITLASGFRFFWSKNSFDIGILYYPNSKEQTDDTFTPIISYTHHFYKK